MNEDNVRSIIDYGLSILEETPDALLESLKVDGPEKAIPAFIASIIQKVTEGDPELGVEDVLAGIIGIFDKVGTILEKAGVEFSKEQKLDLLSSTVELSLQMSPSLHEEAMAMAQEADANGEYDELKAEHAQAQGQSQGPVDQPVAPENRPQGPVGPSGSPEEDMMAQLIQGQGVL